MNKYRIYLYDPTGKLISNWDEESLLEFRLAYKEGLVILVDTAFRTIFPAASGWQIMIKKL